MKKICHKRHVYISVKARNEIYIQRFSRTTQYLPTRNDKAPVYSLIGNYITYHFVNKSKMRAILNYIFKIVFSV